MLEDRGRARGLQRLLGRRPPQPASSAADRPVARPLPSSRSSCRPPPATRARALKSAPRGPRPPADAAGTGPGTSPHSRGVGITLPGFASPSGSNAQRSFWNAARSGSANIFGMCCFLSTPTPCSPVIEPPSSTHALRILPDSSSAALGLALVGASSRRAGAGCRRRRGTRWPRSGRTPADSASIRASTSGSRVRGTTPSCTK